MIGYIEMLISREALEGVHRTDAGELGASVGSVPRPEKAGLMEEYRMDLRALRRIPGLLPLEAKGY